MGQPSVRKGSLTAIETPLKPTQILNENLPGCRNGVRPALVSILHSHIVILCSESLEHIAMSTSPWLAFLHKDLRTLELLFGEVLWTFLAQHVVILSRFTEVGLRWGTWLLGSCP